jgi:hypothetical protein
VTTPYIHPQTRAGDFFDAPWVQACFPREVVEEIETTDHTVAYGFRIDEEEWVTRPLEEVPLTAGYRLAMDQCFALGGPVRIGGDQRIFFRVDRRRDGTATARVHATIEEGHGDQLLCCLREAALPLAHGLPPGHALRWEFDLRVDQESQRIPDGAP